MPAVSINIRLRSLLFFIVYNLLGIVHSLLCLLVAPFLNFRQRYAFVNLWTAGALWLLRHINGIQVEVRGRENLPAGESVVVMANHQSQWETFFLQLLIAPQATVLKRELLRVPFFGWALALLDPIAIDRSKPGDALKTILRVGRKRLAEGTNVVIFPEGTRQAPGQVGRFNAGGAMLACQAGVRVVPIAHNAGRFWPARSLMRYPGTVTVDIGPPIETAGRKAQAVSTEVEGWIRRHVEAPEAPH
ncbi:phospholipid/glycerol acyltransferase [Alcanivorax sp. S71-1-4]|uniref:lysophospholipid acyltransferase family protein n=1 Tax=Alcanivorax sp. S71-1-4 TaxID=1177159 RepID=UPI00135793E2|nr:lysophospholipid acyltransferase family protein [Alcanivorax sp. S71-1-4]KAF0809588.1 phospholipid/glycerol acyltransferase [Alcanivorax sp. S71-1-4]